MIRLVFALGHAALPAHSAQYGLWFQNILTGLCEVARMCVVSLLVYGLFAHARADDAMRWWSAF